MGPADPARPRALARLNDEIAGCRACPRLVAWREAVARTKRAAYADETYWARPVPGFGDPDARIVVVGLAPAAHGANRTGRMFTGDRSGDFLFAAMHRAGLANQPRSVAVGDGLRLSDTWVTAAVRCAPPDNTPTPAERDTCRPFIHLELELLPSAKVIVALGGFAYAVVAKLLSLSPRPRFGHGVVAPGEPAVVCSYHPSQQNTFTGRLTAPMLVDVFLRAIELADGAQARPGP